MERIGATIGTGGLAREWLQPHRVPRLVAIFGVILVVLTLIAGTRFPDTSAKVSPAGDAQIRLMMRGVGKDVPETTPVTFVRPTGETLITLSLGDLLFRSGAWRGRIAPAMAAGPVLLALPDAPAMAVRSAPWRLDDMPAGYWLNMLSGVAGFYFGLAIWMIRPRDWACRVFALIGFGLFATAATAALDELVTIATPLSLIQLTWILNIGSLVPFAVSFLALFLRFPTRLMSGRTAFVPALPAAALVMAAAFDLYPDARLHSILYADLCLALVVPAIFTQAWIGRRDPAKRGMLWIVAAAILFGTLLYFAVTVLPSLIGFRSFLSAAETLPLFMLIYGGIGVAVVRADLFALDGWALRIMLSTCAAMLVMLVDIALLSFVTIQGEAALGIAMALVAAIYLPGRELLLRRAMQRSEQRLRLSLQMTTSLAFAISDSERAARWADVLAATFQPGQIEPDSEPALAARVADDGRALHVPAAGGAGAMLLRHAADGRRLFEREDENAATELVRLVERLVAAREAYLHGVTEERRRIARDLHDDVSGRLMIGLHREDGEAMREDVREAMADIRNIIDDLSGEQRTLGDLLADLRHESGQRLDAVGIRLDWPALSGLADPRPIAPATCRNVSSIMREAISNIVRHAQATTVSVEAATDDRGFGLRIADDGIGMTGAAARGHGLTNIARRAAEIGGQLDLRSAEPGTIVELRVVSEAVTREYC